jgi:uncharacterized protein
MEINDPSVIRRILHECLTIAMVGLSSNPLTDGFPIAERMKDLGYKVIPVNVNEFEVLGERAYPSLEEVPESVDLVNICVNSPDTKIIVEDAIKVGAKAVWFQEGVIDEEAARDALQSGLMVVMDRCWVKEHIQNI